MWSAQATNTCQPVVLYFCTMVSSYHGNMIMLTAQLAGVVTTVLSPQVSFGFLG